MPPTCSAEDVDEQPDPGNARPLRDDQHAERDGWQRIARQDRLEPAGRQEIVDEPSMGGRDAAPLRTRALACGKPMVDPQPSPRRAPHGARRPAPAGRGCPLPAMFDMRIALIGQAGPAGQPASLAPPGNPAPPRAGAGNWPSARSFMELSVSGPRAKRDVDALPGPGRRARR